MATKKHLVHLDTAFERAVIMPVPDFEKKLALLESLELANEPKFKQETQSDSNRWWFNDCAENAEKMGDLLVRHYGRSLGVTKEGTQIHSLPMCADEPFELIGGQIRGQLGDETDEWQIRGYGYPVFHLYWFAKEDAAFVNQVVKWDEEGWIFYGDLHLRFYDLSLIPKAEARFDFTAESLFSPNDEKVRIWADTFIMSEFTKFLGVGRHAGWHVGGISISGISISEQELKRRLDLTISKRTVNKGRLLTNRGTKRKEGSLTNQVRFAVSRLDCLLEDNSQKIYSSCQEASTRVRRRCPSDS